MIFFIPLNPAGTETTERERLFARLQADFPNDVGNLGMFFLNLVTLPPGAAIYLPAGEPHAYLAGDCVECMACSDNVIRAGLTPKYKDVETLLRLVSYTAADAAAKLFAPRRLDANTELFVPPVPDFAVARIRLQRQQSRAAEAYTLANYRGGSVLMVLAGAAVLRSTKTTGQAAVSLRRGSVVFVPATEPSVELLASQTDDAEDDFVAYQAMANDFYVPAI